MGTVVSAGNDRTSLIRGLSVSIRDSMRPTKHQIQQVWEVQDTHKEGALPRYEAMQVLVGLIDVQIESAREEARRVKMDMAKQQAELEKMARQHRFEVVGREIGKEVTKDQLDRAVALHMGSATGPVMAGMMSGYVDIPVTSLTAMKEDEEMLNYRLDLIFWGAGVNRQGKISFEQFAVQYLEFYDNAPKVLLKDQSGSQEGERQECSVQ